MTPGVVTGLQAEARLARPLPAQAGAGAAAALIEAGVTALLSFGFAGGLDPTLPAGAIVIPRTVRRGPDTWHADAALLAALGGPTADAMVVPDGILATAVSKRTWWEATGAAAADLESAAVAEAATAAGLPFAVLRAISDPAPMDLPPAALIALDAAGGVQLGLVLASVVRQPQQIRALLRLAMHAGVARRALRRAIVPLAAAHPWPTP